MATTTSYQQKKETARQEAIDWQYEAAEKSMSWGEVAEACAHFEKLGRRYGLLQEFRENGIC
jgi:outer membrane protein assembly factor BamD (BamD/ComL family)